MAHTKGLARAATKDSHDAVASMCKGISRSDNAGPARTDAEKLRLCRLTITSSKDCSIHPGTSLMRLHLI